MTGPDLSDKFRALESRIAAEKGEPVHSRWEDEAAFEYHAGLPHTLRFLERVEPLIDHTLDVTRAGRIG